MAFLDDDASVEGLSADQIHEAMKGSAANGTPYLDAASGAAAKVREAHGELETMTAVLMGKLSNAWRGDAAELAHSNIAPMVATLRQSQEDLANAQDLASRQSGSFHDATNALVPVPPKPSNSLMNVLTPWHTDLDDNINQWNDAQRRNVAVYTSYTSASNYNHDGMPVSYGDVSGGRQPVSVEINNQAAPEAGGGGSRSAADVGHGAGGGPAGPGAGGHRDGGQLVGTGAPSAPTYPGAAPTGLQDYQAGLTVPGSPRPAWSGTAADVGAPLGGVAGSLGGGLVGGAAGARRSAEGRHSGRCG